METGLAKFRLSVKLILKVTFKESNGLYPMEQCTAHIVSIF